MIFCHDFYILYFICFWLVASGMKKKGGKTTKIYLLSRYHERHIRGFYVELWEMHLKDQILTELETT